MVTYPKDWKECRLSNIVSMKSGESITAERIFETGKYPCFGGNGLRGYSENYTHEGNFALVGRQGALCGNVNIVSGKFFASEHAVVVTPLPGTDIKFMYYVLGRMNLNQYAESSAQPGLSVNRLLGLPCTVPCEENEQKAIVATLSTFDTHIDNLTALIEKKKAIRDGALADLMSGRTRLEGFSGEWEEKTLEEIAILMVDGPFGSDLKTEHYTSNHEARIIQLGNIGDDGWNDENVKYTTFSHAEDLNRCIAHPGDVLIAKMMPAGRSILCPNKEKMYIIASDVVRVELGDNVDSRFIIYSTKGMYYLNQIAENTQGSTRQRTSISKLKKIKLMLPQYDEQKAIADALSAMDAEIDSLKTERDKFMQIREGAMDDLLTGRVRLPM